MFLPKIVTVLPATLVSFVLFAPAALAEAYPGGGGGGGGGTGGGGGGGGTGGGGSSVLGNTLFPEPDAGGSNSMAFTGSEILLLVVVGIVLVTIGIVVLRASRARRDGARA